mmetsp:Transcript_42608/g.132868  ORF Transcript_42608/g.132868 Transcript_42608/m.132868 type:complete len:236 (+) Transcript_42608:806-1513(+)
MRPAVVPLPWRTAPTDPLLSRQTPRSPWAAPPRAGTSAWWPLSPHAAVSWSWRWPSAPAPRTRGPRLRRSRYLWSWRRPRMTWRGIAACMGLSRCHQKSGAGAAHRLQARPSSTGGRRRGPLPLGPPLRLSPRRPRRRLRHHRGRQQVQRPQCRPVLLLLRKRRRTRTWLLLCVSPWRVPFHRRHLGPRRRAWRSAPRSFSRPSARRGWRQRKRPRGPARSPAQAQPPQLHEFNA